MNYCMSDIHGDYEKYKKMLELIHLQDRDNLYILGDVIDYKEGGIKILLDMMMRPNVFPIMGDHEQMFSECLDFLLQDLTESSVKDLKNSPEMMKKLAEWMSAGGQVTLAEFQKLSEEEKEEIADYMEEFRPYDIAKADGKAFILVHAGLDHFKEDRELDDYEISELVTEAPDYSKVYFEHAKLVSGHLPTMDGKIMEKNNHIAIDCGCAEDGSLGCICLETGKKYYV